MKQIRDLLGGDKDGEVEGVALLLRQQGGGRAGRGPNELLGGQGQVPKGKCQVPKGQGQVPKGHGHWSGSSTKRCYCSAVT